MDAAGSWWAQANREDWRTVLEQRRFAPPKPVREVLRYMDEHHAAIECASVGVKTVTYR